MQSIRKLGNRLRLLVGAVVLVVLLLLVMQNAEVVRFKAFAWELSMSLSLLLLLVLIIGFALGYGLKAMTGHGKPRSN